jgi:GNAT superfamily N-acetyltransferase
MSSQSSLQFFHPASVDEAHALVAASTMPVDSTTQRRIRTDESLTRYFDSGLRRPEWVWAVRADREPQPVGVVAAFGSPDGRPVLLDVLGLPEDQAVADELVARATEEGIGLGMEEAGIFAPTDTAYADDVLAPARTALDSAGWQLLVERRHYSFPAAPDLAAGAVTDLRFERMTDADDPRLIACHREVMRDTLDAHDRALIDRHGFDRACVESLKFLVTADPVDRIHLAFDGADEVVGMVSGDLLPPQRGAVNFIGVAHDHRGHGYGHQLLAWQTQQLLAAGAATLLADTDNDNVPMARHFADVGWPQTETRIDLVFRG